MLRLKQIHIDTHIESVAYLHRKCFICASQRLKSQNKLEIIWQDKKIMVVIDLVDEDWLKTGEIGLSEHAFRLLGAPNGSTVSIKIPAPMRSFDAIKSKLTGKRFSKKNIDDIIVDIVAGRYSKIELTAFVLACAQNKLSIREITYLTEAMIASGQSITWKGGKKNNRLIVDKHCIGGIPGNRTTMVLVPIVAAHGLLIPKTSSRAITSPSGTADAMETLTDVDIPLEKMQNVARDNSGCIAWGGSVELSPADDVIIQVERPLAMDSEGQMVASILSKKKAAGSTHILIDIPIGPTAKIRSRAKASHLAKTFITIGRRIGLKIECIITNGNSPIGRGIGPALEARDVMKVLQLAPDAPLDLREKSLQLAGKIIELDQNIKKGSGYKIARDILDSGKAYEKMQAICLSQGKLKKLTWAKYQKDICASGSGTLRVLDNERLAKLAKITGAPQNPRAGIEILVTVGQKIKKHQPVLRLHTEHADLIGFAEDYFKDNPGMVLIQ